MNESSTGIFFFFFTFDGVSSIVLYEKTNGHSLKHEEKGLTPGTDKNNHSKTCYIFMCLVTSFSPLLFDIYKCMVFL